MPTVWAQVVMAVALGVATGLSFVSARRAAVRSRPDRSRRPARDQPQDPEPGGAPGPANATRPVDGDGPPTRAYLVPVNVPPPPELFLGRAEQLGAMIRQAHAGDRDRATVIVVQGAAGIGKTTLAVQFAHSVAGSFPDGVIFGRGGSAADWAGVLASFDDALLGPNDKRPVEPEKIRRTYRTLTSEKRVLVILDDVDEHADLHALLPSGPGCLAIVTTREPALEIDADLTIELPELSPDDSISLLGSMVGPDRVTSAEGERAARTIVATSQSNPLAVTLAGATLASRPHWDLRRAVERLREIRSQGATGALDVTFTLLGDDERTTLLLLGLLDSPVFAPWMLAALLGPEHDEDKAWNLADRLVHAGLVERTTNDATGVSTFRVLDRVHEYVRACVDGGDLDAHEAAAARDRLAEAGRRRTAGDAKVPLMEETYLLKEKGELNRALDVVLNALALARENRDAEAENLAVATLAELNTELGIAADGVRLAEDCGDPHAIARMLRCQAIMYRRDHRIDLAITALDEALEQLARAQLPAPLDRAERIRTLGSRAVAHAMGPQPRDGLADIDRIEALIGDDADLEARHRASVSWALGTVLDYQDRHEPAMQTLASGSTAAEDAKQRLWQAWLLHARARVHLEDGDAVTGREHAGEALRLFADMQHRYGTAHCRLLIGVAAMRQQRFGTAAAMLEETLGSLGSCGDRHMEAVTLNRLAEVRLAQGETADARRLLQRAEILFAALGDEGERVLIQSQLQALDEPADHLVPAPGPVG
ncbi:NB-ARC domain-containing protein [Dactylosporangium sp. NPDC051541]|uniref:NB-ARC domain-containing protein n=1 Tax=Dactylosporangium sp. NPDC051541 TaxID=3363977 RepID=UPI0037B52776